MEQASQPVFFPSQEPPEVADQWVSRFREQALSCGFSGRVFVAMFEPESRRFAVVASLHEESEPFMLPDLPAEMLERLDAGDEVVLPRATWPLATQFPVVMFPLLRQGVLYGAACAETSPQGLPAEHLDTLRQACAEALGRLEAVPSPAETTTEASGASKHAAMAARIVELHARNEIKTRILANLLHELRSPLVAVRGYTRMVLEGRSGAITPAQQQFLDIVAGNTNRLITAVNHAAQLNADELALAPHDLLDAWRCAVERVRPTAEARGIRITERVSEGAYRIVIDGQKIGQVIDALLENAVKYSANNTEIIGEVAVPEEGAVVLKISDSGPGIPGGLIEKMFDRYYQSEAAAGSEAADVRLPLVYDIVRMHGGRLSVASNAGEGCTFVLELPAIRGIDTEGLTSNEQASRSSSGR